MIRREKGLMRRKSFFINKEIEISHPINFFSSNQVKQARRPFLDEKGEQFMKNWDEGFDAYLSGKWDLAKVKFEHTKNFHRFTTDSPSINLLEFMKLHNFVCPPDWAGVRKLFNK